MYKKIFLIITVLITAQISVYGQSGSFAGSFARMGFGARGLSMGNAMVSDIFGDVNGYYNPSLACFQEEGFLNLGYTAMTLDRRMNFVGFARKFKMPSNNKGGAGISLSWINAGVSNIDGRDNDAQELGELSTYENQFYLGTGFLLDENFAFGVGFKLYYSKLYDEVKTNSIGFDIGAVYKLRPDLSLGFAIRDISARYKWETNKIYGEQGTTTENKFPVLTDLGATYLLPNNFGIASIQFETLVNPGFESKDSTGITVKSDKTYDYIIKAGTEIRLSENLKIRAGIDRMDLKSDDFFGNIKPGFGVGFYKAMGKETKLGIDYSFQLEPYTHDGIHNVSIGFKFK
ncbi:MAG: hypothetical protein HY959_13710 [Ignavibacteriae bacterium]|nr:hypothetical protein [Ignavibacteriota bacterium]